MTVNNTSNVNNKEDDELNKLLERRARELARAVGNEPVELDADNFDNFIRSKRVVVVDFWAPWCAPCFLLEPILKALAKEMPCVGFGRLNTQEWPDVAAKYDVMSLPTVIIFRNGEPVDFVIGAVPKKIIADKIRRILSEN
ncbi:thioredoxin [Vulcanisaeta moutnovskia 768-28]|uniref:Thioredoxin n=1 Tax=Vulcanisaeta moutnovskia (strain 768-28) TaxID=985053 RepID=F0QW11_VULM7|nr:thioredoxin [Vulcanisaeta moutnovskia]ADY00935.1 thioredoxin [Vulcanisaeta moutnovskia 768-28]